MRSRLAWAALIVVTVFAWRENALLGFTDVDAWADVAAAGKPFSQQFLMPLNRAMLESAAGAIVHSRWALRRVQAQFPELPAVCIPHHHHLRRSTGSPGEEAARHARQALGIPVAGSPSSSSLLMC